MDIWVIFEGNGEEGIVFICGIKLLFCWFEVMGGMNIFEFMYIIGWGGKFIGMVKFLYMFMLIVGYIGCCVFGFMGIGG